MVSTAGAGRNDWLVGTLRPGEDADHLREGAHRVREGLLAPLLRRGSRWRFNIEPNVNAIIETEKRNIANTAVAGDGRRRSSPKRSPTTAERPQSTSPPGPSTFRDQPNLRVVVLDHDVLTVTQKAADQPPPCSSTCSTRPAPSDPPASTATASSSRSPTPTRSTHSKTGRAPSSPPTTSLLTPARLTAVQPRGPQEGRGYQKQASLEARIAVTRCYKHIYYPYNDKNNGYLRHRELPAQSQGDPKNATSAVITLLDDEGKIRTDSFSASWLRSKTWPNKPAEYDLARSRTTSGPTTPSRSSGTPASSARRIVNGVKNESWVYYDGASASPTRPHTMAGMNRRVRSRHRSHDRRRGPEPGPAGAQAHPEGPADRPHLRRPHRRGSPRTAGGGVRRRAVEDRRPRTPRHRCPVQRLQVVRRPRHRPCAGRPGTVAQSAIKDKGLDALRVITREEADTAGVEVPTRTVNSRRSPRLAPAAQRCRASSTRCQRLHHPDRQHAHPQGHRRRGQGTGDIDLAWQPPSGCSRSTTSPSGHDARRVQGSQRRHPVPGHRRPRRLPVRLQPTPRRRSPEPPRSSATSRSTSRSTPR